MDEQQNQSQDAQPDQPTEAPTAERPTDSDTAVPAKPVDAGVDLIPHDEPDHFDDEDQAGEPDFDAAEQNAKENNS